MTEPNVRKFKLRIIQTRLGRRRFAAIGIAAAAGLLVSSLLNPILRAQNQSSTGQAPAEPASAQPQAVTTVRPAFDAVSIKPSNTADPRMLIQFQPGGRLVTTNLPARILINVAYKLSLGGRGATIGAPGWIDSARFDIEAKAAGDPPREQLILMMQSLLADRFKLAAHWETRQLPVYALVLSKEGKTGPQLVPHASDNSTCRDLKSQPLAAPQSGTAPPPVPIPCGGGFLISPGHVATESTLADLAKNLSWFGQIDREVVDKTGLSGTFDIAIDYAPFTTSAQPRSDVSEPDPSAPSTIFAALKEQLGLKLESQTGPVDVLVIDHIEEPSPN